MYQNSRDRPTSPSCRTGAFAMLSGLFKAQPTRRSFSLFGRGNGQLPQSNCERLGHTMSYISRKFWASVAILAFGTLFLKGQKQIQPNIVFLFSDDQRWDAVGYSGNDIIHTPNLDRLAEEGVWFKNAFVTTAICMSSRGSVATGLYERAHGWRDCGTSMKREVWDEYAYPSLLREAGYYTGFAGKFDVDVERRGWTSKEWGEQFFDVYRPYYFRPVYHEIDGKQIHRDDLEIAAALEFLEDRPSDKPFCLSLWFNAPHSDHEPAPRHLTHYEEKKMPTPATGSESIFEASPEFVKTSMARVRWREYMETDAMREEMVKAYYGQVSGIDEAVGRLREKLVSLNLHDNTVIIFMSDNGFFLGDRGLSGKWLMYEPSIRVPLIVYDPRLRRGKRQPVENLVLNIDIAPTILELAGLPVPDGVHGESLMPLVRGEDVVWRDEFFYEHRRDCPPELNQIQSIGVRTERWKYIRYTEQDGFEELYDLLADPGETRNLATDRRYRERLSELRLKCNHYKKRYKI